MATRGINKLSALQLKKLNLILTRCISCQMVEICICVLTKAVASTGSSITRPFLGKRNDLSLGTYPEVSLDDARTIRDEYKKLIKQGIDPAMERIETKSQKQKEQKIPFVLLQKHGCINVS
jgi:hypothetical protein